MNKYLNKKKKKLWNFEIYKIKIIKACVEFMSGLIDRNSATPEDVEEDPFKKLEADLNWSWGKFYLAALEESV